MDVIGLFFRQPNRSAHVREVARSLAISPTTASRRLEELHKEGLLVKDAKYHHLLFTAADNPHFWDERRAFLIREVRRSGVLERLTKALSPQAILLLDDKRAVRLAIVTDQRSVPDISSYAHRLGVPVEIVTIPTKGAQGQLDAKTLNDMVNATTLIGRWEVFH